MKPYLTPLFLGATSVAVASGVEYYPRHLSIRFDEPVVLQSERFSDSCDQFDLTGDAAHRPMCRWVDQNRLDIAFAEGTSVFTRFRLAFKPGQARYLSGAPMEQTEWTFSCPRPTLLARRVPGTPTATFCIHPSDNLTKEAQAFSVSTPVRYEFRAYTTDENGPTATDDAPIPATTEPATLGMIPVSLRAHALEVLDRNKTDWKTVNKDTPVPGFIVVRAPQPQETGTLWRFRMIPAEKSGFREDKQDEIFFNGEKELGTDVGSFISDQPDEGQQAEAQQRMRVKICFSAPVRKSDLPGIFQNLIIRAKGQQADTDGNTKTLTIDGKETRFTLMMPTSTPTHHPAISRNSDNERVAYAPDDTTDAMLLEVNQMVPTELDIVLPAGIAASNGLTTACEHLHRLSLHPAAPQLGIGMPRLPLRGDHTFLLPVHNVGSLEMQVFHMNAEQFLKDGSVMSGLTQQSECATHLAQLHYQLALAEKQDLADKEDTLKQMRRRIEQTTARLLKRRLSTLPILPGLTAFEPHTISPQSVDDSTLLYSRDICVNLDTLTGGQTKPGFYIVKVRPEVTPAVRRVLESLGLKPDTFDREQYFPIQVTDLLASADEGLLFLTRLSNGSPVQEGEVLSATGERLTVRNGICNTGDWDRDCIVCAGEDYTTVTTDSSGRENGYKLQAETFADRPLYRPGDTVNLRGVLRRISSAADCSRADEVKLLKLTVLRPNGEILLNRDITPDEYGCWAHSFPLPEGDEDITGNYRVKLEAPGKTLSGDTLFLSCQVFRRDAFTAELKLQAAPICPDRFTVSVRAMDFNGTPLSNAEAELKVSCSAPMLSREAGENPADTLSFRIKTDAQGSASASGIITPDFPIHLNGQVFLSVSGSVVNDRKEYLQLPSKHARIHAADFTAEQHRSTIRLRTVATEPGILPREQAVHVRVSADIMQTEKLPNGIVITRQQEKCLLEKDITIPANCEEGIPLPLNKLYQEAGTPRRLDIRISGTDPAGRRLESLRHYYRWDAQDEGESESEAQENTQITIVPETNTLRAALQTHRAGEALLVLQSRRGIRAIPLRVQGKKETQRIPLMEGENGHISCQLFQPAEGKSKLFTEWVSDSDSCIVPRPETLLNVSLSTPEQDLLPGSETELRGTVTLPDGSAADAAVTLFAVDKGMLSAAPYNLPVLSAEFARMRLPRLYLRSRNHDWLNNRERLIPQLLEPLYDGRIVGAGRWVRNYPDQYRAKAARSFAAGGSVEHSAEAGSDEEMEEGVTVDLGMGLGSGLREEESNAVAAAPSAIIATKGTPMPRLRTDFSPVAVWQAALRTDAEGRFSTGVKLPDTLTSYRVFAVAVSRCGKRFGQAESEFRVNQPLMLTPGTPLFMSLGDCLRLPLTITNNTDKDDTWQVSMEGSAAPQSIALKAGASGTLFFDFTAATEGENTLRWTATAAAGGDAVEGSFPVRFPAPVLKEIHHLVLPAGAESLKLAALPAAALADSSRSSVQLELSANPLLHLASALDFVLSYPYGCTEQTASGLLPWILHSRLAPFSPTMATVSTQEAGKVIHDTLEKLFQRQQKDGGLGYWSDSGESCLWASAHAALVFSLAEENGLALPAEKMKKLRHYLSTRSEAEWKELSVYSRYSVGRACGNEEIITAALRDALAGTPQPRAGWWQHGAETDIRFIAELRENPAGRHAAFLNWMRSRGHDYRHRTTWQSGWMLVALGEYLRLESSQAAAATVQLQDGTQMTLGNGITRYTPPGGGKLRELPTVLTTTQGTAYLNVKFRALPEQTDYPGVTEKGLQVTRVYEKKDADGKWKPATEFCVGDVVRVTLTCARVATALEYFVLEDYLPACMEAINPNVPSQAAGLELQWQPWSRWFDHREYLADRVRGFCTRWGGRDLLNMSYYARVKRAGISTAPPAEARLMYEPQIHGLSPNAIIISK